MAFLRISSSISKPCLILVDGSIGVKPPSQRGLPTTFEEVRLAGDTPLEGAKPWYPDDTATHRLGQKRFSRPTLDSSRERVRCIRYRCRFDPVDSPRESVLTRIAPCLIAALASGLSACTNPYDPVQRGLGGGIWGAASGAAIGAAAGGGPGAALGAAIGGATGIVAGVATTPPPPPGTYYGYPAYEPSAYGYPGYAQPGYGYPGYSGYPAYSGPPSYGYPGYLAQPAYPGPPAYGSPSNSGYPQSSAYGYQSRPPYSPYSGIGDGYPVVRYPGDRPSEGWSPGAESGIEPPSV
jgi:hypothetical protein